MPINRIAYFAQTGQITTPTRTYTLPINSANIEVSRPIEAITAFGQFNSLGQAQTNVTTCKASMKGYLGTGASISGLDSTAINDIIAATQNNTIIVSVGPNGYTMTGIATNIGLDISVGGFGMFDLGFAGVGNPTITNGASAQTAQQLTNASLSPVTTMSVGSSGLLTGVAATSIKFSLDMPTDTLTALGENPNANQGGLLSTIATKAPYKASMSVEGFGINVNLNDAAIASGVQIGTIILTLPHGKVTSRSFNNAAGQATASFSYSAEDVGANFGTGVLASYSQDNNQLGSPEYGG